MSRRQRREGEAGTCAAAVRTCRGLRGFKAQGQDPCFEAKAGLVHTAPRHVPNTNPHALGYGAGHEV